jgi:hypothetical protein
MFSSNTDMKPCDTILKIPAGLTAVKILDFDMMSFCNVEVSPWY